MLSSNAKMSFMVVGFLKMVDMMLSECPKIYLEYGRNPQFYILKIIQQ